MKITVIAVGKLRDPSVRALVKEYEKRLPPGAKLEWIEVAAGKGGGSAAELKAGEAERIKSRLPARSHVAALTERGKEMDSQRFAMWLAGLRDRGEDVCFLIGGADGLDDSLIESADTALSLSRLTFPHEMVRAILAEQVYRAFSILRGDPYHRA